MSSPICFGYLSHGSTKPDPPLRRTVRSSVELRENSKKMGLRELGSLDKRVRFGKWMREREARVREEDRRPRDRARVGWGERKP